MPSRFGGFQSNQKMGIWISRTVLACVFLLIGNKLALCQDIHFNRLGIEDGLSHNTVFHILQDSKGEILIGTKNGFNKYNGYELSTFYADRADSLAISNDNTSCFTEDENGYVWVATWGGGLNRFDPHTEHFLHFTHDENDPNSLPDNRVQSVYYDSKNKGIWVGMFEGGLSFLNLENHKFTHYQIDSLSNRVWAIAKADIKFLWIATEHGLVKFNSTEKTFKTFLVNPNPNHPDNKIRSVFKASDGTVFAGSQNGLYWLNAPKNEFVRIESQSKWNTDSNKALNAFCEYPKGTLWIGTQRNGLVKFNIQTEEFQQFLHNPTDFTSLSGNDIRHISTDASGVFWVGVRRGGVSTFNLQSQKFKNIKSDPESGNSLSDKQIMSVLEDRKGNVWVGTLLGGLNRIGKDGKITTFSDTQTENKLNHPEIRTLLEAKDGKIWIGSENGLHVYNPETEKITLFLSGSEDVKSISSNRIRSIHQDKSGNIWVGTKNEGINLFDEKNRNFERFLNPTDIQYANTINQIKSAGIGAVWIGTEAGLFKFEEQSKKFTFYESASKHSVHDILTEGETTWLGTPHGLVKFQEGKNEVKEYTKRDGLPINQVESLLSDSEGMIWVATTKGLSKFDPKTEVFRNYDSDDGLQSNIFNACSAFKSEDGTLYFGGINGFNSFHPTELKDNSHKPIVIITDFKKMGESMSFNKPIDEIKQVDLSYKDNIFTIEFASLDYTMPKKNQYAYTLEGFDNDWIYAGNNRSVTYSNISAGTYTFRVKGSNNDGVWSEEGTSIKISIHPPFWKTNWFYALSGIILIGGTFLFFFLRIRRLKHAKKHLQQEVASRTKELSNERDNLKEANARINLHLEEIEAQRDEIEAQRDDIIVKNKTLEKAIDEIQWQNREIKAQKEQLEHKSSDLEKAQEIISGQNKQLKSSNHILEERVSQRTKELKFAYQDLLRAHKQLDHFTYRSAHDLRGPIARLLGLCHIGKMEVQEEKALEYLSKLEISAQEMSHLLTRLMQTHEIKTKQIQPSIINVQSTIRSIWEDLNSEKSSPLKLEMEISDNINISTDKILFEIMIFRILENADDFKLREEPHPTIKVKISETEIGQIAISITDNGQGIPVEVSHKVFEMFVIGTQNGKGAGIGLYESQIISERLKGKIWLKSSETGHTEFEIILPKTYGER